MESLKKHKKNNAEENQASPNKNLDDILGFLKSRWRYENKFYFKNFIFA